MRKPFDVQCWIAMRADIKERVAMDRRTLLALAATLPGLVGTPAQACSFAPFSPDLQNQQVRRLFAAWWRRDERDFRELFTKRLMADGTPMTAGLIDQLARQDPALAGTFDLFDTMFTDEGQEQKIILLVNTHAGIFVACSESQDGIGISSICGGTPRLHLFLISMTGLNLGSVKRLATVVTPEPAAFTLWTDG